MRVGFEQVENLIALINTVADGEITIEIGKKYGRIVRKVPGSTCAYGFLNLENGDILKAESWKKPHPKARGNINNPDGGRSALDEYGVVYLR